MSDRLYMSLLNIAEGTQRIDVCVCTVTLYPSGIFWEPNITEGGRTIIFRNIQSPLTGYYVTVPLIGEDVFSRRSNRM